MSGLLENKVAIVTGGSSGIGLASVERFVEEGARVAIADIQDDAGTAAAERFGDRAIYVHTDVTDEQAISDLVDRTVAAFGKLDVMFNNAGAGGDPSSLLEVGSEGFDKTIALLTRSVVLGHRFAAKQFEAQGTGGSIISTASAAALQGGWAAAGYTIAKHAVVGVVRQATAELAPLGIRSNAIAPGIIMTPIMARSFGIPMEQAEEFADFLAERLASSQPIGRTGRGEDIANAAAFLGSDLSSFICGTTIPVDGGVTAVTQSGFATGVAAAAQEFSAR